MNRWAVAGLVWLGIDIVLGVMAAPVVIAIFIPGALRAWSDHDLGYVFSVVAPNLVLMIVPGGIAAAAYLFVVNKVGRG